MKIYKHTCSAQGRFMAQSDKDFSTQQISPALIRQIIETIKDKACGSVEIFVENYTVTQITERTITKLSRNLNSRKITYLKN